MVRAGQVLGLAGGGSSSPPWACTPIQQRQKVLRSLPQPHTSASCCLLVCLTLRCRPGQSRAVASVPSPSPSWLQPYQALRDLEAGVARAPQ